MVEQRPFLLGLLIRIQADLVFELLQVFLQEEPGNDRLYDTNTVIYSSLVMLYWNILHFFYSKSKTFFVDIE